MLTFIIIVAIIILLLFISITICVTIEDETQVSIKYGVLKFKLDLSKEKLEEREQTTKENQKKKARKANKTKTKKKPKRRRKGKDTDEDKPKPPRSKEGVIEQLKGLLIYVTPVLNELKIGLISILKCLKFKKIRVIMFVANEDAHQTAIEYAKTSSTVSSVISFLMFHTNVDVDKVQITPDFLSEKSASHIYFELKFRTLFLLHNVSKMVGSMVVVVVKTTLSKERK